MSKSINVFISHHGEDDEHVQDLKTKIAERGCKIENTSVDSTNPNNAENEDYIRKILRDRISSCDTFICLIGYETYNREWVEWEIETAHEMGKKILGVFAHGAAQDAEIPETLQKYSDSIIGWRIDEVIDFLENDTYYSEKPDGTPRPPVWDSSRGNC